MRTSSFRRSSVLAYCRRKLLNGSKQSSAFPRQFSESYYDSQSGLHVPVHNENSISMIVDKSQEDTSTTSFIPAQLYKEDPSSDMPEKLQELKSLGVSGVILPKLQFPRDIRNLQTLTAIAPTDFLFLCSGVVNGSIASSPNVSRLVHYSETEEDDVESTLRAHVEDGASTTISLKDIGSAGPIVIANRVAKVIDMTGGGNFIYISSFADADDMLNMCEEMMYLDVAGATVKSRLLVESLHQEVVEEIMFSGVNKFVVHDEQQMESIQEIAASQGKSLQR